MVFAAAEVIGEFGRRAHLGDRFQRVARRIVELAARQIKRRAALARNDREGERQRRMRDVGAADIERPGDVLRIRHNQCVATQLHQLGPDAHELVGRAFAGELDGAQHHAAGRRRRTVAPQRVDRIIVDRHQRGAGAGARLAQLLGIIGRVQPRVVAELGAYGQILLQPLIGRIVDQVLDDENRLVDLARRLHGIAAVHE